jgi:hypothetical protein
LAARLGAENNESGQHGHPGQPIELFHEILTFITYCLRALSLAEKYPQHPLLEIHCEGFRILMA